MQFARRHESVEIGGPTAVAIFDPEVVENFPAFFVVLQIAMGLRRIVFVLHRCERHHGVQERRIDLCFPHHAQKGVGEGVVDVLGAEGTGEYLGGRVGIAGVEVRVAVRPQRGAQPAVVAAFLPGFLRGIGQLVAI